MKHQYSRRRFLRFLRIPLTRAQAGKGPIANRLHHHAKVLVIVIFEGDKTERLKNASRPRPQGIQHFGHAVNVSGVSLKSDFDEIALGDRGRQLQQASGCGNDLQAGFGTVTVA